MPSRTTSSDAGPGRIRVLLVDDNQAMLARAASMLAATCTVVGQVQDGVAALAAAAMLVPDVIVLDTVHDDPEIVEAAQAAGGIGFVVKARLASDLLHAVHEARARRPFVSIGR
jgi:DNA-binding NarL/FixJ family response regulator